MDDDYTEPTKQDLAQWAIIGVLISCVFLLAAALLYLARKRRAQQQQYAGGHVLSVAGEVPDHFQGEMVVVAEPVNATRVPAAAAAVAAAPGGAGSDAETHGSAKEGRKAQEGGVGVGHKKPLAERIDWLVETLFGESGARGEDMAGQTMVAKLEAVEVLLLGKAQSGGGLAGRVQKLEVQLAS